jgi:hypothetical protein
MIMLLVKRRRGRGHSETDYKDAFMNDVVPSSNGELVKRISNWKARMPQLWMQ